MHFRIRILAMMKDVLWLNTQSMLVQYAGDIFLALLVLVLGWKISGWVGGLMGKVLEKQEVEAGVRSFLVSLIGILLKAAVIISVLGTLGVPTTAFAAVVGAMGLAIGMALSGNLSNFAGGILILIFKPLKVGEFIEAQGHAGSVSEIAIFHTTLLTPDNKTIIIPNGPLSNGSLVNYSRQTKRRVDLSFGIGYGDDSDEAIKTIKEVIARNPKVLNDPAEPFVRMAELADSSVNFAVRVWVESGDYWDVHFFIVEEVKKAFDEKGISIPFPQREVHVYQAGA